MVKIPSANAGDIKRPGLGRSPGEGNGYPLQCSRLRIPWTEEQQAIVHRDAKSWTDRSSLAYPHVVIRGEDIIFHKNGVAISLGRIFWDKVSV